MSDIVTRARVLLDEGLTPGFWASWEEHPAQPVVVGLLAEIERLGRDSQLLGQANYLLARIVAVANISAIDGADGFIEAYNLPVGPIHKAIPFLNEQGIVVTADGQIKNGPEQRPDYLTEGANMGVEAWCECSHHASWHPDGGPCAYVTTVLDDHGEWQVDSEDCKCGQLELQHVEIF